MGRKDILGIAINDTEVTAVRLMVGNKQIDMQVAARPWSNAEQISLALKELADELNWHGQGPSVIGFPLSSFAVRNLQIPFHDEKKRAQILPFELESRLLVPAEQVASVSFVTERGKDGTALVAFAAEKNKLKSFLAETESRLAPWALYPAVYALARKVQIEVDFGQSTLTLLLFADVFSVTLVCLRGNTPFFFREIILPEFWQDEDETMVMSQSTGENRLSQELWQNINLCSRISGHDFKPEKVLLAGPLAQSPILSSLLSQLVDCPLERAQFFFRGYSLKKGLPAPTFDAALACALQGYDKGDAVNFRQGEFARPRVPFRQRKDWLITALFCVLFGLGGLMYLWNSVRVLTSETEHLRQEMVAIYKGAFPGKEVVHDPYLEMLSAQKEGQKEAGLSLFAPQHPSVVHVLAVLSKSLPAGIPLKVSYLIIDQERVQLKGETDSFKTVDTVRSLLAASSLFTEAQIISTNIEKKGDGNTVLFELSLQLTVAEGGK